MEYKKNLRDLKLNFHIENMNISAIDFNHGVFLHSFARHMHSFYELHYIVSGHGRLVLDDQEYDLESGHLFLLAPKVYHAQFTDTKDPMEEYHFSFEMQQEKSPKESSIGNIFTFGKFSIGKDAFHMEFLFKELESELNNCGIGYKTAVRLILEKTILTTARNFFVKTAKTVKDAVLDAVPDDRRSLLMDEAFLFSYKNLTLEGLAAVLNLSPRHTERLICEKYGTTFVKYRTQSRLNAAVNMMGNTDLKLYEIAERCGFSSYLHFAKQFQNAFGIAPSVYRRKKLLHQNE